MLTLRVALAAWWAVRPQEPNVTAPKNVVKAPLVLEFLDLQERSAWLERDLEQTIIDRLESFLLELGKLTHQDLGQMQMYVNYFDRHQREAHEAPTVGIVLCSDKNDAMVKITPPEDDHQVHASRSRLYLPTEDELREELEREREEAERTLRLSDAESDHGEG